MISLKKRNEGFTIVELLIVIVVIAILAALVITAYGGITAKARDTERQTDVKALHSQLEAFYGQNGYYPTLAHMNDSTWRGTNMKGLDADALKDPKGTASTLVGAAAADSYSYAVTTSGNADCSSAETSCAKYVLTATLEKEVNGSTAFVKNSLN